MLWELNAFQKGSKNPVTGLCHVPFLSIPLFFSLRKESYISCIFHLPFNFFLCLRLTLASARSKEYVCLWSKRVNFHVLNILICILDWVCRKLFPKSFFSKACVLVVEKWQRCWWSFSVRVAYPSPPFLYSFLSPHFLPALADTNVSLLYTKAMSRTDSVKAEANTRWFLVVFGQL